MTQFEPAKGISIQVEPDEIFKIQGFISDPTALGTVAKIMRYFKRDYSEFPI